MNSMPLIFIQMQSASIAAISEKGLISEIRQWLGDVCPEGEAGIGDDAAVLPIRSQSRLITTDSIVCGRHFKFTDAGQQVGQKLIERNLSDIAAMGGIPDEIVVALFLTSNVSLEWLREFYLGIAKSAREAGVHIVGGDITQLVSGNEFAANATVIGHADHYITRVGGRVNDSIFVTGALGGSLNGRHLRFRARLKEGQWLAKEKGVCAMMDISDGLFKDLPDLMGEGLSAKIDMAAIPIHLDAFDEAKKTGRSALHHAMSDGEDYELLVVVDGGENPYFLERWEAQFPELLITRIGKFIQSSSSTCSGLLIDSTTATHILGEGYDSVKELNKKV
jgi:thiamine-monophosphate kinase